MQFLAGAGDVLGTGAGVVVAEKTDSSEEIKNHRSKDMAAAAVSSAAHEEALREEETAFRRL